MVSIELTADGAKDTDLVKIRINGVAGGPETTSGHPVAATFSSSSVGLRAALRQGANVVEIMWRIHATQPYDGSAYNPTPRLLTQLDIIIG